MGAKLVADTAEAAKLKKTQGALSNISRNIKDAILVEKAQAKAANKAAAETMAKIKKAKTKFDSTVKDHASKLSDARDEAGQVAIKVAKEEGLESIAKDKLQRTMAKEKALDNVVSSKKAATEALGSKLLALKRREAKLVAAKLHSLENNGEAASTSPTAAMEKMAAANELRNTAMETTAKMVNSAKP